MNEMHIEHSEQITEFAAAFVIAQAAIEGAIKDSTNPHFRSKYADLSSVCDACKGPLNANGIGIIQAPVPCEPGKVALETMLLHKSGQWMRGRAEVPLPKNDPQGYGSAMTYARRYSLAAMAGVCPEDDDAEGAMQRNGNGQRQNGNRRPPPPPQYQTTNEAESHDAAEVATDEQLEELKKLLALAGKNTARATEHIYKTENVKSLAQLTADQAFDWIKRLKKKAAEKAAQPEEVAAQPEEVAA